MKYERADSYPRFLLAWYKYIITKNHLPGFSTLASNSVIGGAEGGSLLVTSDGALANHTHYSALMGTSIVSQVE